jgi:putative transposase
MGRDLHSYSSSLGRATLHISLIPKYRHRIFGYTRIKNVCERIFFEIADEYNFVIKEMGFDIDHVHLVVDVGPNYSASDVVKLLKGISSRKLFKIFPWLRERFFWGGHLWSGAYFFDSIGDVNYEVIQNYVRKQELNGNYQRTLVEFMPPILMGGS